MKPRMNRDVGDVVALTLKIVHQTLDIQLTELFICARNSKEYDAFSGPVAQNCRRAVLPLKTEHRARVLLGLLEVFPHDCRTALDTFIILNRDFFRIDTIAKAFARVALAVRQKRAMTNPAFVCQTIVFHLRP
jgi:hypothetical protein